MNYALDALWWKLEQRNVRDLASLLTAPPLWQTGCELPVAALLGETGFRYLLALDKNPEPLLSHLEKKFPYQYRLGFYAEHLLTFWFTHSPHWQLLARNVVLTENKKTIGAIDFIAQTQQTQTPQTYHIELTCKYYFSTEMSPTQNSFIGLSIKDHLNKKVTKLSEQLKLTTSNLFQDIMQKEWENLHSVSIVRGNAFTLSGILPDNTILNPYAWEGKVHVKQNLPKEWQGERFIAIKSLKLLSPARVPLEETLCFENLQTVLTPQIIIRVAQRYDGLYHEQNRFVLLNTTDAP